MIYNPTILKEEVLEKIVGALYVLVTDLFEHPQKRTFLLPFQTVGRA